MNQSSIFLSRNFSKHHCKTNFLQYYQILNSTPNHLLNKARDTGNIPGANYIEGSILFELDRDTEIDPTKKIQWISISC